jgi:hypothetical protein
LRLNTPPAAQNRRARRLLKTSLTQLLAEPVVLSAAGDLADDIDVLGGAGRRRTGVREPKVDRGAADKDDLVQDWAE